MLSLSWVNRLVRALVFLLVLASWTPLRAGSEKVILVLPFAVGQPAGPALADYANKFRSVIDSQHQMMTVRPTMESRWAQAHGFGLRRRCSNRLLPGLKAALKAQIDIYYANSSKANPDLLFKAVKMLRPCLHLQRPRPRRRLQRQLRKGLLTLAQIAIGKNLPIQAGKYLKMIVLAEPTFIPSLAKYPPDIKDLYLKIRRSAFKEASGRLQVMAEPHDVAIYLDGIKRRHRHGIIKDLPLGLHTVQIGKGRALGRLHRIKVRRGTNRLTISLACDLAYRMRGERLYMRFGSIAAYQSEGMGCAATLGRQLGADKVVLISRSRIAGKGAFRLSWLPVKSGRISRIGHVEMSDRASLPEHQLAMLGYLEKGIPWQEGLKHILSHEFKPLKRKRGLFIGSMISLGLGLAAGVVGIIYGVKAKNAWNSYDSYDRQSGSREDYNSLGSRAATYGKVANSGIIIGGVAMAAGVTMLIVDLVRKSKKRKAGRRRAYYMAPLPLPGGAGLAAGFSF